MTEDQNGKFARRNSDIVARRSRRIVNLAADTSVAPPRINKSGSSQNFGKTAHHGLKPVAIYRQPFRLNDVKTPKQRYFTA